MSARTRYDDAMLAYCGEQAQKTIDVISRVLAGDCGLSRAAYEAGFDGIGFRKGLRALETMSDPVPKDTPADVAEYLTAEERLYGDVFRIAADDYDAMWSIMPRDCEDVMQWIYHGAGGALIGKEADMLKDRYDCGMTLDEIGNKFGVCRERARQIISRAIRKLRRPAVSTAMRYGIQAFEKAEEEYQMQKAEIIRGIVDERLKKDADIKAAEATVNGADAQDLELDESLNRDIIELELSVRSFNALLRHGIRTVRDLTKISGTEELAKIRNLGMRSVNEIIDRLTAAGIDCPLTSDRRMPGEGGRR